MTKPHHPKISNEENMKFSSNFYVCGEKPMVFKWDLSHCTFTRFYYFILYVILTFESVEEILWRNHSNGTFLTVLSHGSISFVLYVIQIFESVEEILWCDHSNGTFPQYFHTLWHGSIFFVSNSNFWVFGGNLIVWPFKWNLSHSTFTWFY